MIFTKTYYTIETNYELKHKTNLTQSTQKKQTQNNAEKKP
jgi:hypothetical protein